MRSSNSKASLLPRCLADAILTGQVPTALVENVTQRQPVAPVQNYGLWPEVNRGKNFESFVIVRS